ncbi:MAG: lipid A phosphoethanolamine transferase, partial [Muribaculaceae bacterium]|nr:lipid A phosphoethanolamine transferase [Muribaculaceae bacterium]
AYLAGLLAVVVSRKWMRIAVKTAVYIYFGFFALVETGCVILFDKPLGVDMIGLALETNPAEAGGFFEAYFSARLLTGWMSAAVILALASCTALLLRRICRRSIPVLSLCTVLAAIVMAAGVCQMFFLVRGLTAPPSSVRGMRHGDRTDITLPIQLNLADPLFKTADLLKEYRQIYADIDRWLAIQPTVADSAMECDSVRDFNIVLVIGESFIRSHSSLYGYRLPTNPLLEKELKAGRLVVFSDMATPANLTTEVMRNILNLNDVSAGEPWHESVYFPALVKRAGWNVYHFDNQTVGVGSDSGISRLFYSDFNMDYTLDGVSDSLFAYDGPYVDYTRRKLRKRKPGKCMVMYHLLGQHFPASGRFEGQPVFSADDVKARLKDKTDRQLVADYDNATLYNDHVVARIIDSWRDTPTVLLYFSDHGEDLPDLGTVGGRVSSNPDDKAWLERQYHIPFMVWMSDAFMQHYPDLAKQIRSASDRSGMLDKLGYIVIGLTGAKTDFYKAGRDMFSPDYRPEPRITIGGFSCD